MIASPALSGPAFMLTAVEFLDPRAAGFSSAAGWYRCAAPQLDVWAGDGLVAGACPDVTASLSCHTSRPHHTFFSTSLRRLEGGGPAMDVVDLDAVGAPGRTRSGAALRGALNSLGDRLSADWLPWAPTLVACSVEPYGSWTVTVAGRVVASGVHEEDLEDDFVEWTA